MKKILILLFSFCTVLVAEEPIKVLMVTGGGWHDYKTQAPLLKELIETRLNAVVDVKWTSTEKHPLDKKENKLPEVFRGDFSQGYDVVLHNHCQVGFTDDGAINKVIDNHIKNKVGIIMLHGAFHTWFKTKEHAWDRICGVHSNHHHHKSPLKISVVDQSHPVMKALGVEGQETKEGELYSTKLNEGTQALAKGYTLTPHPKKKKQFEEVCIFSQKLGGVSPMIGITLGHHNSTMNQDVYKDLITNAVLWSAGKLDKDGKPEKAYLK